MRAEQMAELADKRWKWINTKILIMIACHALCLFVSSTQHPILRRSMIPHFTRDLSGGPDTTLIYHFYAELRWPLFIDGLLIIAILLLAIKSYRQHKQFGVLVLVIVYSVLCIIQVIPDILFKLGGVTTPLTGVRLLLATGTSLPSIHTMLYLYYGISVGSAIVFICSLFFVRKEPRINI